MPKYSVQEVLAIIKELSPEEKRVLQAQLPNVLSVATVPTAPSSGQSQSNAVSDVTFGTGSGALNFSPVQSGRGSISVSPSFAQQTIAQNADLQQVLSLLAKLKQDISVTDLLDPLVKDGAKAQVERIETELKKPEPDKDLVSHTIATLKKGLEGVQALAGPVIAVASLIAKAWGIPAP